MTVRGHLVALTLGILVPALAFSTLVVLLLDARGRAATERHLTEMARAVSVGVDHEVEASIASLRVLADSEPLRRHDIGAFHEDVATVVSWQSSWDNFVLYDGTGREVFNLLSPHGRPRALTSHADEVRRAASTGEPVLSNVVAAASGKRAVSVLVPSHASHGAWVLGAILEPAHLGRLLTAEGLAADSVISLVDRDGIIIARSRRADRYVGERATPDVQSLIARQRTGVFRIRLAEGEVYAAVHRSPMSGWTVVAGVPTRVVTRPLYTSLGLLSLIGLLLFVVAVAVGVLVARRITRAISRLSALSTALVVGDSFRFERSSVREIDDVADAVEAATQERRRIEAQRNALLEETERRRRAAESLADIGRIVSQSLDPREVAQRIVNAVHQLLGCETAALFLVDEATGELHVLAATDLAAHWSRALPKGIAAVALALARRRPVSTPNILADDRIVLDPETRELIRASRYRAVLAAPLALRDRTIGALGIAAVEGRVFDDEEVALVQSFCDQAAIALDNARLYVEADRRRRDSELVIDIGQAITRSLDPHEVSQEIAERLRELMRAQVAAVFELTPDGTALRCVGAAGVDTATSFTIAVSEPRVAAAIAASDPIVIPNLLDRDRVPLPADAVRALEAAGLASALVVPLRVHDRSIGVIGIADARGRVFDGRAIALGREVAPQAAAALANARLYHEVQHAYDELARTQEQLTLAQKMEALGRLASGVAHDFNNLLTVITGRAIVLEDGLGSEDPLYRQVELIENAASRASVLTQQLLAFSRKQVMRPQLLDLNELVTSMSAILRRLVGEDIDYVTRLADGPCGVKADPSQLEQALLNLVVNARDAIRDGGTLTVETRCLEIGEHDTSDGPGPGAWVVMSVTDTGAGMTPEVQARIFDPFFTTKAGKGTGLGMAIVYGVVKQSDGHITVDSRPGQGTTFRVFLPRVDVPEGASRGEVPKPVPRGTETILLAEDDTEVRNLVETVLTTHGYTVLSAADGAEALRLSSHHEGPIALLLSDVVMPQLSGRALLDKLRGQRPGIRVLYMSGYTEAVVRSRGVFRHTQAFIQKPFSPVALAQKVREVLTASV